MIELHKFCLIVGKLVPSYPDKKVFLIHIPVELALMEPNAGQVIYMLPHRVFYLISIMIKFL